MTGVIFINYRRSVDWGFVQALLGRLEQTFSATQLFIDISNIPAGADYMHVLNEEVARCDIFLAVIGKDWSDVRDAKNVRRLEHPQDAVRIEIALALAHDKRIIPVLAGDARMPRSHELPEDLKLLAKRNAVRLTHDHFKDDASRLIGVLRKTLQNIRRKKGQLESEARRRAETRGRQQAAKIRDGIRERSETQTYEILSVDTEDSQKFFNDHAATIPEKMDCQKIFMDTFVASCRAFGGWVRIEEFGDSGVAYFEASKFGGTAVRAAEKFLSQLPMLQRQTERLLPGRRLLPRRFRIAAHYGTPDTVGSFVKYEKQIASIPNHLFITEQLRQRLDPKMMAHFVPTTSQAKKFGSLSTTVYRLLPRPVPLEPLQVVREGKLNPAELNFLKRSLEMQVSLSTAQNLIATQLINRLTGHKKELRGMDLVQATLKALHAFLQATGQNTTDDFNVAFWRPNNVSRPAYLTKLLGFPREGPRRKIKLRDDQYQVVRSFKECAAFFHEDVKAAASKWGWFYFDREQASERRKLHSTAQIPVYRNKNAIGEPINREVLGVLSVDTSCPEFFHPEDASLWIDRTKSFLVNLALSQILDRKS
jgi:TIR domain-containing protein